MKTSAINFRIHLFSTETATKTNHVNKNQNEKEPNATKWEEEMYMCDVDSTLTEPHNIRIFQQEFYPEHSSAFPKMRQAHAFRLFSKRVSATISHW